VKLVTQWLLSRIHRQGWLYCDIPGTDTSSVVKDMMDELYDEFTNWNMPNRVHKRVG